MSTDAERPLSPDEFNKAQLAHLVMMFAATSMQQMGKMVNPATGRAEVDLEGAQASIDMIDMLHAKTRGNLDAEEEKLFSETLTSLKLNFVQTQRAGGAEPPPPGPAAKQPEPPQAAPPSPEAKDTSSSARSADDEKKKYHKSYG
jgi:hypothetical protein